MFLFYIKVTKLGINNLKMDQYKENKENLNLI